MVRCRCRQQCDKIGRLSGITFRGEGMITPSRRKWLAERLRRLADEEEQSGFGGIAAQFSEQARMLEEGLGPETISNPRGRPISQGKRRRPLPKEPKETK